MAQDSVPKLIPKMEPQGFLEPMYETLRRDRVTRLDLDGLQLHATRNELSGQLNYK